MTKEEILRDNGFNGVNLKIATVHRAMDEYASQEVRSFAEFLEWKRKSNDLSKPIDEIWEELQLIDIDTSKDMHEVLQELQKFS